MQNVEVFRAIDKLCGRMDDGRCFGDALSRARRGDGAARVRVAVATSEGATDGVWDERHVWRMSHGRRSRRLVRAREASHRGERRAGRSGRREHGRVTIDIDLKPYSIPPHRTHTIKDATKPTRSQKRGGSKCGSRKPGAHAPLCSQACVRFPSNNRATAYYSN